MENYGVSFKAKYGNGRCGDCKNGINAGQIVRYRYPGKVLCHLECVKIEAEQAKIELEAPYRLGGGSGYGCLGWTEGQVIMNPHHIYSRQKGVEGKELDDHDKKALEEPEYLYVISTSKRYFREDGMSFGVGDESGYTYGARCRAATDDESAPLRAGIEKNRVIKEAKKRLHKICDQVRKEGEYPDKANPEGELIGISVMKGSTLLRLYGGGMELQIDEKAGRIWVLDGNGADGDDWSRNNAQSSICHFIPFSAELADEIRNLDAKVPKDAR
ncbi:MAG: hypothetical protein ABIG69_04235 [Bacteroidota bacterium]